MKRNELKIVFTPLTVQLLRLSVLGVVQSTSTLAPYNVYIQVAFIKEDRLTIGHAVPEI